MLERFEKNVIAKLDLKEWNSADNARKKAIMSALFEYAGDVFRLKSRLFFTMPKGFEQANGLSDPSTGDIHINESLWASCGPIEPLFFFLHEIRHSIQSSHPELFPKEYEINSHYVIQFDGTGYKVDGDEIEEVKMDGEQGYFTELYLASPCEQDANAFAYRCLKAAGAGSAADALYEMWSPEYRYFRAEDALGEFMKAVERIDRLAAERRARISFAEP